jgi:hypothetical protein
VHCNVDVDEDVFGDVHEDGDVFKYEVVYEDEDVSSGHHGDSVCLSVCPSVMTIVTVCGDMRITLL